MGRCMPWRVSPYDIQPTVEWIPTKAIEARGLERHATQGTRGVIEVSCPDYYITSDGREFWEFFRDSCHSVIDEYCILNQSQCHAIESACEYLYRSGIKTQDPIDDIRKAFSLIDRAIGMEATPEAKKQAVAIINEVVGVVILERARKMIGVGVTKADPIRIALWTITP